MKFPDKYGVRINTKNFRRVESDAALSIDYDQRLKIIEIEFINNDVYHYLKSNKKEWDKFIELANKGSSLGTYINQEFKKRHNYYKLIVVPDKNDEEMLPEIFKVRKPAKRVDN
jgi:hypothetical protein